MERMMADPKKSAEAARKIQEINRTITTHQSNISRIEREKSDKVRYFDQQIKREQDEVKRHSRTIDELKRQI
jgi:phage-related minor tail protein